MIDKKMSFIYQNRPIIEDDENALLDISDFTIPNNHINHSSQQVLICFFFLSLPSLSFFLSLSLIKTFFHNFNVNE